jgi:hypothetical protein
VIFICFFCTLFIRCFSVLFVGHTLTVVLGLAVAFFLCVALHFGILELVIHSLDINLGDGIRAFLILLGSVQVFKLKKGWRIETHRCQIAPSTPTARRVEVHVLATARLLLSDGAVAGDVAVATLPLWSNFNVQLSECLFTLALGCDFCTSWTSIPTVVEALVLLLFDAHWCQISPSPASIRSVEMHVLAAA